MFIVKNTIIQTNTVTELETDRLGSTVRLPGCQLGAVALTKQFAAVTAWEPKHALCRIKFTNTQESLIESNQTAAQG